MVFYSSLFRKLVFIGVFVCALDCSSISFLQHSNKQGETGACPNTARVVIVNDWGSASFLEQLEYSVNSRLRSKFNLLCGISGGALAVAAMGMPCNLCSQDYKSNLTHYTENGYFLENIANMYKIIYDLEYSNKCGIWRGCGSFFSCFGSRKNDLCGTLCKYFGGVRFSELRNDVIVTYEDKNTGNVTLLNNCQYVDQKQYNYLVRDVVAGAISDRRYLWHELYPTESVDDAISAVASSPDVDYFPDIFPEVKRLYNTTDSYYILSIEDSLDGVANDRISKETETLINNTDKSTIYHQIMLCMEANQKKIKSDSILNFGPNLVSEKNGLIERDRKIKRVVNAEC